MTFVTLGSFLDRVPGHQVQCFHTGHEPPLQFLANGVGCVGPVGEAQGTSSVLAAHEQCPVFYLSLLSWDLEENPKPDEVVSPEAAPLDMLLCLPASEAALPTWSRLSNNQVDQKHLALFLCVNSLCESLGVFPSSPEDSENPEALSPLLTEPNQHLLAHPGLEIVLSLQRLLEWGVGWGM